MIYTTRNKICKHDAQHEKPEPGERVLFYAVGRWHVGELIEMHGRRPGWWDGSSWVAAENVRWWIELPVEPPESLPAEGRYEQDDFDLPPHGSHGAA
jgi:hypothetical protein